METVHKPNNKVGANLTEGPIFSSLLLFAIPIILTNLLQQLYGLVDLAIIGRFVGTIGTVGVSTGGEIADLVTPIATGFATAGQIYIAQLTGAKEHQRAKDTVGTLLSFMMILALSMLVIAMVFCVPILRLLNCPQEALGQAEAYMCITALGFPAIYGYNAVCGVLRGMGESKRPLLFVIIAASVNVVADILLVAVIPLEAAGTAIATVLSQYGSFFAAFIFLLKSRDKFGFKLTRSYFRIRTDILWIIVKLGIPQVARSMLVRFSLLWINSNINVYGLTVSATNSVGNKIQKLSEVFIQGIDSASAAMVGQNLGAKKYERAKKTTLCTLLMTMICALLVSVACLTIPKQIFGLFQPDEAVKELGVIYLQIMVIHFFSSAFIGSFQTMVTGSGFVSLGFLIGILDGVVCKIGLSMIFVYLLNMGYVGYFLGIACSRILPGIVCAWYFFSNRWRKRKLLTDDT